MPIDGFMANVIPTKTKHDSKGTKSDPKMFPKAPHKHMPMDGCMAEVIPILKTSRK